MQKILHLLTVLSLFVWLVSGCTKETEGGVTVEIMPALDNEMLYNQYPAIDSLFAMVNIDSVHTGLFAHSYTFVAGLGYQDYVSLIDSDSPTLFCFMEVLSGTKDNLAAATYTVSERMVPGRVLFLWGYYYPFGTQSDSVQMVQYTSGTLTLKDTLMQRSFEAHFFSADFDTLYMHYDGPVYLIKDVPDSESFFSWFLKPHQQPRSCEACQNPQVGSSFMCRFRNRCGLGLDAVPSPSVFSFLSIQNMSDSGFFMGHLNRSLAFMAP